MVCSYETRNAVSILYEFILLSIYYKLLIFGMQKFELPKNTK